MAFFPKVCSKREKDQDETKLLRNPTGYIHLAAVPKKLAPHACQRIPFHSDLYVSARNDKLRAVKEKKAKRKLVFRSKETFHPTMRLYREERR